MSLRALTWAIYDIAPTLTDASAYRILLVLADEADNDGRGVYLSAATIAERTGLSPRTVATKLKDLETMGITRRGDQSIVAYLPANRRPIVRDLNITTDDRGAKTAPQNTQPEPAPKQADADMQQGCNRGATDMQQGCNMVAYNPYNPYNPSNPRETARDDEPDTSQTTSDETTANGQWTPNDQTIALADSLNADLDAELERFHDWLDAKAETPHDPDAAFRGWLRRGADRGFLTRRSARRPSDRRAEHKPHKHHANCEHVLAALADIESEYDHTSPTEFGDTSEWALARQTKAEELNQLEQEETA